MFGAEAFCGRSSSVQNDIVDIVVVDKRERRLAGDLSGDSEFASAGDAEQLEYGVFYGLNLVRIIEATGVATGCA